LATYLAGSCVNPPTIQLRICCGSKFAPAAGTAAPSTLNTRNELLINRSA
jgi:hypothetical protein